MSTVLATLLFSPRADAVCMIEILVEEAIKNQEIGMASFEIVFSLWAIHCGDRTVRLG